MLTRAISLLFARHWKFHAHSEELRKAIGKTLKFQRCSLHSVMCNKREMITSLRELQFMHAFNDFIPRNWFAFLDAVRELSLGGASCTSRRVPGSACYFFWSSFRRETINPTHCLYDMRVLRPCHRGQDAFSCASNYYLWVNCALARQMRISIRWGLYTGHGEVWSAVEETVLWRCRIALIYLGIGL